MNAPILAHRHLTPRPFFARHADIDFTIDLCAAPEKVVALLPRFFSPLLLPLGLLCLTGCVFDNTPPHSTTTTTYVTTPPSTKVYAHHHSSRARHAAPTGLS